MMLITVGYMKIMLIIINSTRDDVNYSNYAYRV